MDYSIGRGEVVLGSYSSDQVVSMYISGALKETDLWFNTETQDWCALPALVDWLSSQPPPPAPPPLVVPPPFRPPVQAPVREKPKTSALKVVFTVIACFFVFLFVMGAIGVSLDQSSQKEAHESQVVQADNIKKYDTECGDNPELNSIVYKMVSANFKDEVIDHVISCVNTHKICIGMPEKALKLSWGEPDHVNSTTTSFGTSKQLVYDSQYVYVNEDGLVTSWQSN